MIHSLMSLNKNAGFNFTNCPLPQQVIMKIARQINDMPLKSAHEPTLGPFSLQKREKFIIFKIYNHGSLSGFIDQMEFFCCGTEIDMKIGIIGEICKNSMRIHARSAHPVEFSKISLKITRRQWIASSRYQKPHTCLGSLTQMAWRNPARRSKNKYLTRFAQPLPVAATSGLGNGVEPSNSSKDNREIQVNARFHQLGAYNTRWQSIPQSLFDLDDLLGPMSAAHQCGKVNALRRHQFP